MTALLLNSLTSPGRIVHIAVVFDGFNTTLALFFPHFLFVEIDCLQFSYM